MVNESWRDLIVEFSDTLNRNTKQIFIHVVGDSIIDEDYQVKISRISPECPNVHVLLSEDDQAFRKHPGGAANVCYQLSNFNIIPRLFTLVDNEACRIIRNCGVKYWGGTDLPKGYFVPRKKRFYEKGFQVVARWDIEKPQYGLDAMTLRYAQAELTKYWSAFQAEPQVIIFSDYNKGLFSGDFKLSWFNTKATTIVDPKVAPLEKWEGCTVFKPNSKEAEALSGSKDWRVQCDFFKKKLNCRHVVITQEGDGVVGYGDDYFEYRPNCKVKPLDIIGAGDCFIGVLALAIANGFHIEDAAKIAFHGGLMYVQQKRGMFGPWSFHAIGKILKNWKFLKDRDCKLVFTNGCFDLIHSGHLKTLEFAKSKGDKLIVGVNSDESVTRLKGESRPILSLSERMNLLAALECVDYVIPFSEDTPQKLIENIKPDVLVKGCDWANKEVAGADVVKEVCYVPLISGHSTSEIINKIKSF